MTKKLSFEDHQEMGDALYRMRNELMEFRGKIGKKSSKPSRQLQQALSKIERARCLLDNELFADFPERETNELTRVYYGPRT